MGKKSNTDIIQVFKSNTFIIFIPVFIYAMSFLNKVFIFEHYSLPISLINIRLEDLYGTGITIALVSFLIFFIFAGIFLTIEMYIIQNLPEKLRKKGYEILIGIYLLSFPISLFGIFEYLTTDTIEKTIFFFRTYGTFILVLLCIGIIINIFKFIFQKTKKRNGIKAENDKDEMVSQNFIFNALMDKYKIRNLFYYILLFLLAIAINYSFVDYYVRNNHFFYTTEINNSKYILIDEGNNRLILKEYNSELILDNILIQPINDAIKFKYVYLKFDIK